MFCKNGWTFWTRNNELENDKPTLRTKTTMFWISLKLCSCLWRLRHHHLERYDIGACFPIQDERRKASAILNALLLFTKYQSPQTEGGAYGALQSKWEGWRRGLWSHCFFFFNRTENIKIYKDGWRQSNPSECVFVHVMCMRENDAGSLTLVQRDTHTTAGDECLFEHVCMRGFTYSTTRIRRLSYAHHSSDGKKNTEGLCIRRNRLPANWVKVQKSEGEVQTRSSSVHSESCIPIVHKHCTAGYTDRQRWKRGWGGTGSSHRCVRMSWGPDCGQACLLNTLLKREGWGMMV